MRDRRNRNISGQINRNPDWIHFSTFITHVQQ
jgi:hypothetical protein